MPPCDVTSGPRERENGVSAPHGCITAYSDAQRLRATVDIHSLPWFLWVRNLRMAQPGGSGSESFWRLEGVGEMSAWTAVSSEGSAGAGGLLQGSSRTWMLEGDTGQWQGASVPHYIGLPVGRLEHPFLQHPTGHTLQGGRVLHRGEKTRW